MRSNLRKVVIVLLSFMFVLVFVFLFVLLWSFNGKRVGIQSSRNYVIREFNPQTNKTSFGFVTLSRVLGKNDFITYRSGEEIFVVVSNIGSTEEFECRGSCYCDGSRRNVQIVRNGLYFLISALTLGIASKIAKEYFDDECVKMFSKVCEEGSVNGDVDSCGVSDEGYFSEYWICRGNCLLDPKFDVTKLELEDEQEFISIKERKNMLSSWCANEFVETPVRPEVEGMLMSEEEAVEHFRYFVMIAFCKHCNVARSDGMILKAEILKYGNICYAGEEDSGNLKCTKENLPDFSIPGGNFS